MSLTPCNMVWHSFNVMIIENNSFSIMLWFCWAVVNFYCDEQLVILIAKCMLQDNQRHWCGFQRGGCGLGKDSGHPWSKPILLFQRLHHVVQSIQKHLFCLVWSKGVKCESMVVTLEHQQKNKVVLHFWDFALPKFLPLFPSKVSDHLVWVNNPTNQFLWQSTNI